jgi:hypothetical protein
MVWKLGTALFAVTTAALLARDLSRPEPDVEARSESGIVAEAEPGVEATVFPTDERTPPDDAAEAEKPRPEETPDPELLRIPARDLALRLVPRRVEGVEYRVAWKRLLRALEARRTEVLPILEEWIGRIDEIEKAGGYAQRLPSLYAQVAGRDGVARLEALASGRRWRNLYIGALCSIRDRAAVDALRRLQEAAPPNVGVFHLRDILKSEGGPELLREWAITPPEHQAHLREAARRALFTGSSEDRDWVWSRCAVEERMRLVGRLGRLRTEAPWQERIPHTVAAALDSGDSWARHLAVKHIVNDPEAFPPETVEAMERVLSRELAAEPGTELEIAMKKRYEALRGWRERREKRLAEEKAYAAFLESL